MDSSLSWSLSGSPKSFATAMASCLPLTMAETEESSSLPTNALVVIRSVTATTSGYANARKSE